MNGLYKNYVWVTNGKEVHRIPKEKLDDYITLGYRSGKKRERWFTIEQLATDNYARAEFNILDTLEWYNKLHVSTRVEKCAKVDLG